MQTEDLSEVIGVIGKLNRTIDGQDQQIKMYQSLIKKFSEKFGEEEVILVAKELGMEIISPPQSAQLQEAPKPPEE